MNKVLKKYHPPKGSLNYIVSYSLIVRSVKHILPRAKNFGDLNNFKSDDEVRDVILEYKLDDGNLLQKLIGKLDKFGFLDETRTTYGIDWRLYVTNTHMRELTSKGIYVNNYSLSVDINQYFMYRLSNKLNDFLL